MSAFNASVAMEELGIDRDNFRVLGLLPLVFVAWADGAVQRSECAMIRRVARSKGWLLGTGEALLETWLTRPPEGEYVRKGLALLKELAQQRSGFAGGITPETLSHLLILCKEVAEAAGGLWGYKETVCAEEEQALTAIAQALGIGDAHTWRRIISELEAMPDPRTPGPKGHLLLGSLPLLAKDPLGLMMRCMHEYGNVVRFRVPGTEWFLISEPSDVQYVLIDNARNYVRGRSYDRFRVIFGQSIGTTDGDQWRPLRRIAQPAFRRTTVGGMGDVMVRCTEQMLDRWAQRDDPDHEIDLAASLHELSLRIIGLALFSTDLQQAETRELCQAVGVAMEYAAGTTNPFRLPSSVPTRTNRRFARAMKCFESFVLTTLAERAENGNQPEDLMSMLLHATGPGFEEGLSHMQIRNEMLSYLFAGHETTASTLSWAFYLLSRHPTVSRRLDQELTQHLGDAPPTLASIESLNYLEMVILETLRLYPAVFMLPREVVSEDRIGGFVIPAKSWILVSPYVTHRRPQQWDNPEGFDPERFSAQAQASRHACAYLPFFAGPHKCVGQVMSMMEMKLVLATVWQRCRLDLRPGFEPEVQARLTLRARRGMWMCPRWRGGEG